MEAGLCNIVGTFWASYRGSLGGYHDIGRTGAFYQGDWKSGFSQKWENFGDGYAVGFNASQANDIYGRSKTVTPSSRKCLFLIKY